MQNRRLILAKLAVEMATVAGINTVIRVYTTTFDLTQFTQAQLPLLAIIEPAEETDDELTSQRTLMALVAQMSLHFLHWGITPNVTFGAIIKAIRDKIGDNFGLDGLVTEVRIDALSTIGGAMPLFNVNINLEMKYYLNEMET